MDCPPNLGPFVSNALVAANEVIIPVKTDYLSFRGLELILDNVNKVKSSKRLNPDLQVRGVIATMYRKQTKDHQDILQMLGQMVELLGVVKESVDVSKGDVDGIPVVTSHPKCEAAKAYMEIARNKENNIGDLLAKATDRQKREDAVKKDDHAIDFFTREHGSGNRDKTISARINEDRYMDFKRACKARGLTPSACINMLIADFILDYKKR